MEPENNDLLNALAYDLSGNYERLVVLYWRLLHSFVIRRMVPIQDAEDLVQEIFLRAYLALNRYSVQQISSLKLRAWLYTIAWNACTNYLSRNKQPPLLSLEAEADPISELEDTHCEQPDVMLELRERREELETLVSSLPPRYREVLSLYYFEELSQQEIADILNVRVGTIKVNVYRGLKLLQKAVALQTNR